MQPELVERHERQPASVKDSRELSIWPFVTSRGFAPKVLQTVPQRRSFSEERCPGQSVHVVSLGVSTTTWEWGISVSTPVPSNTPLWPWRLHANFSITISCPDITDSPIRYYMFWKVLHSWFNQLINPPCIMTIRIPTWHRTSLLHGDSSSPSMTEVPFDLIIYAVGNPGVFGCLVHSAQAVITWNAKHL